jgi:hypothetical protein
MGRTLFPLLLGLLLVLPARAMAARTVVLTGDPILIRLAHRQPTAVTFPEPIAAVPTGADPQQLSLELDGPRLFLQPLEPTVTGLLFAIGVSGRSYALRFAVLRPESEMVAHHQSSQGQEGKCRATGPCGIQVPLPRRAAEESKVRSAGNNVPNAGSLTRPRARGG